MIVNNNFVYNEEYCIDYGKYSNLEIVPSSDKKCNQVKPLPMLA